MSHFDLLKVDRTRDHADSMQICSHSLSADLAIKVNGVLHHLNLGFCHLVPMAAMQI